MVYWYLVSLTDKELVDLCHKTDVWFWHWVKLHYDKPTPETAYQVERWRRLNYMIHDEMIQEDRLKRNRNA